MTHRPAVLRALGTILFLGLASVALAQAPVAKRLSTTTCPGAGCVIIPVEKMGAVAVQVVGTLDGTITFTGSVDGRNFNTLELAKSDGTGTATTATAAGTWFGNVGGLRFVRAAFTSYNSGTPTVTLSVSPAGGGGGSGGSGGTVNQGTASATEQWLVNCVTGCTSASSADDDGSIPAASTNSNANALLSAYNGSAWTRVTFGQAAMAASLPVTIASNQSAVPASQSGTWTVQPGNTANTTAWLVTGTGGTFPATQSGSWNVGVNAGTNVIGKARLVTSAGDEVTDDTADAVKVVVYDSTGAVVAPGVLDPCKGNAKGFFTTSFTGSSASLVTGTASKKTYICSIVATLPSSATETFSIVAGTGTVCATSTAAVMGNTAGSTGFAMGFALGNGDSAIAVTETNQDDLCAFKSSTTDRLVIALTYAVQ